MLPRTPDPSFSADDGPAAPECTPDRDKFDKFGRVSTADRGKFDNFAP